MNVLGIIAEYNPFHNGHKYHIEQSKKELGCDYTVAVMSGNFVQRGEPAILNKWTRSKVALLNGVDLVIELPVIYSIASAEFFSNGAISTLNATNIITHLSFGSEEGSLYKLNKVADVLIAEPNEYSKLLKNNLSDGLSFAVARKTAIENYLDETVDCIDKSNNILAIEYLKSLKKLNSNILPHTIERIGARYNDTESVDNFSSATAIRNNIDNLDMLKSNLPSSSYDELINNINSLIYANDFFPYIKLLIQRTSTKEMKLLPDVSEGLENRIIKVFEDAKSFEEAVDRISTRRYPATRIQRTLFHLLLDMKKDITARPPEYIRILGFNNKGRELINLLKEKSSLPVIHNPQDLKATSKIMSYEVRATNIYNSISGDRINSDYYNSPVIVP